MKKDAGKLRAQIHDSMRGLDWYSTPQMGARGGVFRLDTSEGDFTVIFLDYARTGDGLMHGLSEHGIAIIRALRSELDLDRDAIYGGYGHSTFSKLAGLKYVGPIMHGDCKDADLVLLPAT